MTKGKTTNIQTMIQNITKKAKDLAIWTQSKTGAPERHAVPAYQRVMFFFNQTYQS
jgi:hypothetical protein